MRSQTITHGGVTAEVRSKTRRTPILEAQYAQVLRMDYPPIGEYERALMAIAAPILPVDEKGHLTRPLTLDENAALTDHAAHVNRVNTQHQLGAAYAAAMAGFVPSLARLFAVEGGAFSLNERGIADDVEVSAAFDDFLDDSEAAAGFWSKVSEAIQALDTPLTPVAAQPPEALSEAEQTDPLPVAPA